MSNESPAAPDKPPVVLTEIIERVLDECSSASTGDLKAAAFPWAAREIARAVRSAATRPASAPAQATPDLCRYTPVSSRVCEWGTSGCTTEHGDDITLAGCLVQIANLHAEIERLRAAAAPPASDAERRDAARYRWLRENMNRMTGRLPIVMVAPKSYVAIPRGKAFLDAGIQCAETLDAAIDAAISAAQPEGASAPQPSAEVEALWAAMEERLKVLEVAAGTYAEGTNVPEFDYFLALEYEAREGRKILAALRRATSTNNGGSS